MFRRLCLNNVTKTDIYSLQITTLHTCKPSNLAEIGKLCKHNLPNQQKRAHCACTISPIRPKRAYCARTIPPISKKGHIVHAQSLQSSQNGQIVHAQCLQPAETGTLCTHNAPNPARMGTSHTCDTTKQPSSKEYHG